MVIITIGLKFIGRQTLIIKYQLTTCFETAFRFIINVIIFFSHFYIFLPNDDVSTFLTKLFWCIFKQGERNHLHSGSNIANTLLLRRQNRSCDEHKTPKQINSHFFRCLLQNIRKKSTGRRSNGSTSHFVSCETKPNNQSMLYMKFCLCCV